MSVKEKFSFENFWGGGGPLRTALGINDGVETIF